MHNKIGRGHIFYTGIPVWLSYAVRFDLDILLNLQSLRSNLKIFIIKQKYVARELNFLKQGTWKWVLHLFLFSLFNVFKLSFLGVFAHLKMSDLGCKVWVDQYQAKNIWEINQQMILF